MNDSERRTDAETDGIEQHSTDATDEATERTAAHTLSRRATLRGVALGAVAAACPTAAAGATGVRGSRGPAAIEASPGEDITDQVVSAAADGGTATIPAGTYRLDGTVAVESDGWTIEGAGIGETRLVLPAETRQYSFSVDGADWTLRNFTLDFEADNDTGDPRNNARGGIRAMGTGGSIGGIRYKGMLGEDEADIHYALWLENDADDLAIDVQNVYMLDGGGPVGELSYNTGIACFSGGGTTGPITFDNVQVSQWGCNTFYFAEPTMDGGPLTVRNSYFTDTNVGVRIPGNSVVENTVIDQRGAVPTQPPSGDHGRRGLWLRAADVSGEGPIAVRNCDFTGPPDSDWEGAIISQDYGKEVSELRVENCRIHGNVKDVKAADALIRDSCVTGEISGIDGTTVRTENVSRSGCDPATEPPAGRDFENVGQTGPPAVGDSESAPTDPDGDGRFEDVNGNGETDYDDVVTLFDEQDGDAVRNNVDAFDFNDNGAVDYDDVVTLFERL